MTRQQNLLFEDTFDGMDLDHAKWFPFYLPHWSQLERSKASPRMGNGFLRLFVSADQKP